MKKRKFLIYISLFLVFTLLVTSCSSSSTSVSSNGGKILFCAANLSSGFKLAIAEAAVSYANDNNIDLTIVDTGDEIEPQIAEIRQAKSQGYDAIICLLANADTAQEIIAAADGLPIAFMNTPPDDSVLESDKYVYIGSDENTSGAYEGQYIADYFSGESSIDVVLFRGGSDHPAAQLRTASAKRILKKSGIDVDYVFEDTGLWSRDTAESMMDVFLSLDRNFDAVICNNDEMAIGVINSLKKAGIDPSSIPITGVDATADGRDAIKSGDMAFTVYQSAIGQTESSIQAAVAFSKGESIESLDYVSDDLRYIWVPFEPVDASNVSDYD